MERFEDIVAGCDLAPLEIEQPHMPVATVYTGGPCVLIYAVVAQPIEYTDEFFAMDTTVLAGLSVGELLATRRGQAW